MRKDLILTAVISAVIASTISVIAVFASSIGVPFPDVDENAYYSDSVYKMRSLGVVTGYENGNFGPNDFVTRGQLATMLDRYDQALLGSNKEGVGNGISPLVSLLCDGGIDVNLTESYLQVAYDSICADIP